ncbi:hypothetical protein IQ225_01605 [Synechocystis salina LEGE 06155]|nr:hypothetical protein [Synechocystis salina LEGE 06155]
MLTKLTNLINPSFRSIAKNTFPAIILSLASFSISQVAQADTLVKVTTSSNVGGAGTDSNIYIKLFGTEGDSKRYRLQDLTIKSNILEGDDDDHIDYFLIPDEIGSAVTKIIIESDGKYPGSDWHLDSITTYTIDGANFEASHGGILSTVGPVGLLPMFIVPGIKSTFEYEGWITGDETFAEPTGRSRTGVELMREEPVATKQGSPELVETDIYVVVLADALDSQKPESGGEVSKITRRQSLIITDTSSNRVAVGAEATVGYTQGEVGYNASLSLSAEYEYVKENTKDQEFETTVESEADRTVEADPGSIQFKILSSTGRITKQPYKSTVSNNNFVALYIDSANIFDTKGVTFTKNNPDDEAWNRSVAKAIAISRGKQGYNKIVQRLKGFGILKNPLSYEQARDGIGGGQSTYEVRIDCEVDGVGNESTTNTITATFFDKNANPLGSGTASNANVDCSSSKVTIKKALSQAPAYVQISTDGDDGFMIDLVEFYADGTYVRTSGVNNDKGWCLSTDPDDDTRSWIDAVGDTTCEPKITWGWTVSDDRAMPNKLKNPWSK